MKIESKIKIELDSREVELFEDFLNMIDGMSEELNTFRLDDNAAAIKEDIDNALRLLDRAYNEIIAED